MILRTIISRCLVKESCMPSKYLFNLGNSSNSGILSTFLNKITINNVQKRNYSLSEPIQTQTGIIRMLSESSPVQFLQNELMQIHDITGLPWWATIITSTVLLRTCITVPLAVYQQIIIARLELIKLEMNDIVKELKKEANATVHIHKWKEEVARRVYNRAVKEHWKNLIIRDNCHPFKTSLLMLVQIPLWISLSISFRNMAYMLPYQNIYAQTVFNQLAQEGFVWIQNLTECDPFYILPVSLAIINLLIIELQSVSKIHVPTKVEKYLTNALRGLCIILIPISATMPSCMVLYWTISSVFGLIQNSLMLSPKIRRTLKIPQTPSELEAPYKEISLVLKQKFSVK